MEKEIWFEVERQNAAKFLQFAKNSGCVWLSKNTIEPKKDYCGFHMAIKNNILAIVPTFAWLLCKNSKKFINFGE